MLTDCTTAEQRALLHRVEAYVITHPEVAVVPSLGVDGCTSIEVRAADLAVRDAAVAELAGMFHLPHADLTADKTALVASDQKIAVWTSHARAGVR